MSFTWEASIVASRLSEEKTIAGTGYGISATTGAKIVADLATILHTPIVVVAKTSGNKSKCAMYRLQNWPAVPKVETKRLQGTTVSV